MLDEYYALVVLDDATPTCNLLSGIRHPTKESVYAEIDKTDLSGRTIVIGKYLVEEDGTSTWIEDYLII
jgi:hypothetical protein